MKVSTYLHCPVCNELLKLANSDSTNDDIYYYTKRNTFVCSTCSTVVVTPAHLTNIDSDPKDENGGN